MPILQNKLVIKSIEALHDEALALVPNTDKYVNVNAPPVTLNITSTPQESPVHEPKDTSTDASPTEAGDHNIMARIDHLLRKLDEDDDVSTALRSGEGSETKAKDQTGDAFFDSTKDGNGDDILDDDQKGEKPQPNQTKALADIAEAIYQAQHQAIDFDATDASQNNSTPFDMGMLSATVADEVRRTVSAVMIAELPHLVRDAVGKEIRELPGNILGQSKPVIGNPSATKSVAARKTAATRKSASKKVGIKKSKAKKALGKTNAKKPSIKKLKPKELGKKTTAKTPPST